MDHKTLIAGIIVFLLCFPATRGQSPETPLTGLLNWQNLSWEFCLGPGLNRGILIVPHEGLEKQDYQYTVSPGFQVGIHPLYQLTRKFSLRSGITGSLRTINYSISGNDAFKESMMLAGLPFYGQLHAGTGGLDLRGFTGFQFNVLARHRLYYDVEPLPNYSREGSLNLGFDRSRLQPELHVGMGIQVQVSRYFLGVDLVYFLGLLNQNRYSEPRVVHIYEGDNSPLTYTGAGFRSHGLIMNLVLRRARL